MSYSTPSETNASVTDIEGGHKIGIEAMRTIHTTKTRLAFAIFFSAMAAEIAREAYFFYLRLSIKHLTGSE